LISPLRYFQTLNTERPVWLLTDLPDTVCGAICDCEVSMPLINIVVVLIVVGVLLWLVNRFIPMQGTIKSILNAVVVIAVVLWLLNVFGLFHSFSNIHVGT